MIETWLATYRWERDDEGGTISHGYNTTGIEFKGPVTPEKFGALLLQCAMRHKAHRAVFIMLLKLGEKEEEAVELDLGDVITDEEE